uniref:Uncharacterized protein AlNc14C11G1357 n=1 Tax=Albugo laibachii Nc14 TaxID=890382 RepID=F0W2X8_9STRA|nr:conserved hypothetical protein [Albugo laibachii Nc14]|eukprot:CCA15415.1 conserved hypothetical protein [Albugo laibachii Nc14]
MTRWKLIAGVSSAHLFSIHSFTVTVWNMCGKDITVYDNVIEETLADQCSLTRTYKKNDNGMIRMGRDPRATLAEFSFTSFAWYDISIVHPKAGNCSTLSKCLRATGSTAFNIDMEISPAKSDGARCVELLCLDDRCADAYKYPSDDTKTHACDLGTDFDLTFCPKNRQSKTPEQPKRTSTVSHPSPSVVMVTQETIHEESRDDSSLTVADHTSATQIGRSKSVSSDLAQKSSKLSFAYESSSTDQTSSSTTITRGKPVRPRSITIARAIPLHKSSTTAASEEPEKKSSSMEISEELEKKSSAKETSQEPEEHSPIKETSGAPEKTSSRARARDVPDRLYLIEAAPVAPVKAPSAEIIADVSTTHFHGSSKEERLDFEESSTSSSVTTINMKNFREGGSKIKMIVSLVVCISVIVAALAVYMARKKKKLLDALDDKNDSPQFLPNESSSFGRHVVRVEKGDSSSARQV